MAWYWLVDPIERLVEVYELRDGVWALVAGGCVGETVELPPFAGVEVELGAWWAELDDVD